MENREIFENGKKKLFKSLKSRIFFLTFIFGLIVETSAIIIGYRMYSRSTDRFYAEKVLGLAELTASLIDKKDAAITRADVLSIFEEEKDRLTEPDEDAAEIVIDELQDKGRSLLTGEHRENFANIERVLHIIRDTSKDNDYIYYLTYDEYRHWMIFITDVIDDTDVEKSYTGEDFFPPCTVWVVDEEAKEQLTDPDKEAYTVYSSGSEMVISKFSPVYGEHGEELGYIGVDLKLSDVLATKRTFLLWYCLAIGSMVFLLSFLLLLILSRSIVRPIEMLEKGCQNFVNRLGTELLQAPDYFADLKLHTGDEIEKLWMMLADMEINVAISMRRIKKMTTEKERTLAELSLANQIQSSMLPSTFPAFPDRSEFDLYARMIPAKEVGGDLYDYFLIDDDHLALVIADVSGKGISAALFMVMTKQLLKSRTMTDGADPVKILTDVNSLLMEDNRTRLFVTVFLGILTISDGHLNYANAGHEFPAIRRKDGEFAIVKDIHSAPVAAMKRTVFKANEMVLDPGDTLYLYTDGITEARDKDSNMFGKDRLIGVLNEDPDAIPEEIDNRVRKRVREFENGVEPFDDCTSLCLKYYGSKAPASRDHSGKRAMKVPAEINDLPKVHSFVEEGFKGLSLQEKEVLQLRIITEEIFINIASYAYQNGTGDVMIEEEVLQSEKAVVLTFSDEGIPFDPLKAEEPDITKSASERKRGGLGLYYVKKRVDAISYEYRNGKNVLIIKKSFS